MDSTEYDPQPVNDTTEFAGSASGDESPTFAHATEYAPDDATATEYHGTHESELAAGVHPPRKTNDQPVRFQPGDQIGKSYIIEREVLGGAEGEAYQGREISTNRPVFIKKLYAKRVTEEQFRKKASLKAKLTSIDHPGCVRCLEIILHESSICEVFEYCEASSLQEAIQHSGSLAILRMQFPEFIRQMSEAIDYLHQRKLVHRDIKPENVLVLSVDPLRIKITDYGTISNLDEAGATRFEGTPKYSPPESQGRAQTKDEDLEAFDWWALGRIAQEILDGQHSFDRIFEWLPVAESGKAAVSSIAVYDEIMSERYRHKYPCRAGMVEFFQGNPLHKNLLRGLLTTSVEHRWRASQVTAWLAGQQVPDWYDQEVVQAEDLFEFQGQRLRLGEAARVLSQPRNFAEAAEQIMGNKGIALFIRQKLRDRKLDGRIQDLLSIGEIPRNEGRRGRVQSEAAENLAVWLALWSIAKRDGITLPLPGLSLDKLKRDAASGDENLAMQLIETVRLSGHRELQALFEGELTPEEITILQKYDEESKKLAPTFGLAEESQNGAALLTILIAAAKQGDSASAWQLYKLYSAGRIVRVDLEKAFEYYAQAHADGHPEAREPLADRLYEMGLALVNGDGVKEDEVLAAKLIRKAAEQGHAHAQTELGFMYSVGRGVQMDRTQAVYWTRQAAEQGHPLGQFNLGWMYEKGVGVGQDHVQAVLWYRQAAEQGHPSGQNNLGWMYENGFGVGQDHVQAVLWYRRGAEQGHSLSQRNLGRMHQFGRGVEHNDAEAVSWYRQPAEQGDSEAQCNLGWMYENGRGVAQNHDQAFLWYSKAAEQEHARAQFNLGRMYQNGRGVTRDDGQSVYWFGQAAEQGNAEAQMELGWMCEHGRGISKSNAQAVKWYHEAAKQSQASGQFHLGRCLVSGIGVQQNPEEAVPWFRKAADQGESRAQYVLGIMFENGEGGLPIDKKAAEELYRLSAEQGHEEAKLAYERLSNSPLRKLGKLFGG